MRIRREEARDIPKIHTVNVTAFGSAAEADIVDVLRSNTHDVVSLVAEEDGEIVGHIMFSPVQVIGAAGWRAMALAPMAVIPQRQRTGIGSQLVRAGLDECRRLGALAVFVVGHPSYYPRFGFAAGCKFGFDCEFDVPDDVFMVAELLPGPSRGRARHDLPDREKSGGWFATFTFLDLSGAIGSSQLRRLGSVISKTWRATVRSVSDRSKSRSVGV